MQPSSGRRLFAVQSRVARGGRARARARGAHATPVRVRLQSLLQAAATARLAITKGVRVPVIFGLNVYALRRL